MRDSTKADELKQKATVASELKKKAKDKKKRDKFIRSRMWFSTLISMMFNDRGTIPPNIGNDIMITNNVYITRYSLSAIIKIGEFSEDTPVGFVSDLIEIVKSKVLDVIIDVTIKSEPYWVNLEQGGMKYRVSTWETLLSQKDISEKTARRTARQLYTYHVVKSGEPTYKSRVYITVRATTGTKLNQGISAVLSYLDECSLYKVIRSDLKTHLDYVTILGDKSSTHMKGQSWMLTSQQVLAEMFPQTQGLNDSSGTLFGLTRENNSPYWINLRATANAKNILVVAKSGFGKTFMVLCDLIDAYASGYNLCIMDVKGTEFTDFTRACGGIILSMRTADTHFVNTFVMSIDDVHDANYGVYYNTRIRLSRQRMIIMCQFKEEEKAQGETLLDDFLTAFYRDKGVSAENPNTWKRTNNIHPYGVYEAFEEYCSREVKEKYGNIALTAISRLGMYMSRRGNSSHTHRDAYAYKKVLDTKVLTFDFGILEGSISNVDPVIFQLRIMDMQVINDAFISHKKSAGEWTLKVLEESQICENYLLEIYVREMTLRRAQNQVTFLLCNSISALQNNPIARPLLDVINVLIMGVMIKSNQEYIAKEYDLDPDSVKKLELIANDTRYMHNFLLVNRMQQDATTAIIKTFVPKDVVEGKLFKVVDTIRGEGK